MAEYIKREALLEDIQAAVENGGMGGMVAGALKRYITRVPAADVAQVRHGRWTDGDPYCPMCRKNKFVGLDADIWADWKPDYCPNCGAKMDGGDGNSAMA